MEQIIIRRLKFGTHMKLSILNALAMSIVFSLIMLIMSLLGGNVTANLGSTVFTGTKAGYASLFIGPLVFLIFGVIIGLLSYLPFRLLMKLKKSLNISYIPFEEKVETSEVIE